MKMRKLVLALALAGMASGVAQAAPYVGSFNPGSGYDPLLTGVTGFDIFSNGSAAFFCNTVGGCNGGAIPQFAQIDPRAAVSAAFVGNTLLTFYQGVANVVNPGVVSPNLVFPGQPGSGPGPGRYQITAAALFNELVVTVDTTLGTAALAPIAAGSRVSLFYDCNNLGVPAITGPACSNTFITNTASILAGVGYTDSRLIADGAVSPPPASALTTVASNPAAGTASGAVNIVGPINFAQLGALPNTIGFNPLPGDFQATTTLQLNSGITGFQTVRFFDNANGWLINGGFPVVINPAFVERADANVDLSAAAPEPASLSLLGIALAGLGLARRRRT